MSWVRARVSRGKAMLAAVIVAAAGLAAAGGLAPSPSAEPTVQAFLLAWQSGRYQQAAALTTGPQAQVTRSLAAVYGQLDAADRSLHLGPIVQHGDQATASFTSAMTLGRGGLPWTYRGRFDLVRSGPGWKVAWRPSVIVPGLQDGQRLAVRVLMPDRAQLLDASGDPLTLPSMVYLIGVRPEQVADPAATARALAAIIGVDRRELAGQITAAPSDDFLELDRLTPASYQQVAARLRLVPGLIVRRAQMRLFRSIAPAVTGSIGSAVTRTGDQPFRPGATTGLSGLQRAFQQRLSGSATTQVVVDGADGRQLRVLASWPGRASAPVRTTLDAGLQRAADQALSAPVGGAANLSATIVAIRAGSGQILAVGSRTGRGLPALAPLSGAYRPGQAYTIVSAAALLRGGFQVTTPIPCLRTATVGERAFVNSPPQRGVTAQPPFSTDFARGCQTAFAGLYLRLSPAALVSAAQDLGVGAGWKLPLAAFAGTMPRPSSDGALAADSIGLNSVRVSPLAMALAAGAVQAGTWHPPSLVTDPPDPGLRPRAVASPSVLAALRGLMREAVRDGAARAAGTPDGAVNGQAGSSYLSAGRRHLTLSWFVGYRGTVAYAVLVAGPAQSKPGQVSSSQASAAAVLAGQFARQFPVGS